MAHRYRPIDLLNQVLAVRDKLPEKSRSFVDDMEKRFCDEDYGCTIGQFNYLYNLRASYVDGYAPKKKTARQPRYRHSCKGKGG